MIDSLSPDSNYRLEFIHTNILNRKKLLIFQMYTNKESSSKFYT